MCRGEKERERKKEKERKEEQRSNLSIYCFSVFGSFFYIKVVYTHTVFTTLTNNSFFPFSLVLPPFSTTNNNKTKQHIDATLSGKNGGTSRGNDDRNVALEAIGSIATECNQRLKIGEKNVLVNDQKRLDTIIEILRKGLKVYIYIFFLIFFIASPIFISFLTKSDQI